MKISSGERFGEPATKRARTLERREGEEPEEREMQAEGGKGALKRPWGGSLGTECSCYHGSSTALWAPRSPSIPLGSRTRSHPGMGEREAGRRGRCRGG